MMITVNEPGAKTLKDVRPMQVNGRGVYVVIDGIDGNTANLMIEGRIVETREIDGRMSATEAQAWAIDYLTADVPAEADEEAVAEAVRVESVYADAAQSVRTKAAETLKKADELAAFGEGVYITRNSEGKKVRFHNSDPRHPMRRAATLRKNAAILFAWTAQDEAGYVRYISEGIGDTNGWFFHEDRCTWKRFHAA